MAKRVEAYELGNRRNVMEFLERVRAGGLVVSVGSVDYHTIRAKNGVDLGHVTGQLQGYLIIRGDLNEGHVSGLRKLAEEFKVN